MDSSVDWTKVGLVWTRAWTTRTRVRTRVGTIARTIVLDYSRV